MINEEFCATYTRGFDTLPIRIKTNTDLLSRKTIIISRGDSAIVIAKQEIDAVIELLERAKQHIDNTGKAGQDE